MILCHAISCYRNVLECFPTTSYSSPLFQYSNLTPAADFLTVKICVYTVFPSAYKVSNGSIMIVNKLSCTKMCFQISHIDIHYTSSCIVFFHAQFCKHFALLSLSLSPSYSPAVTLLKKFDCILNTLSREYQKLIYIKINRRKWNTIMKKKKLS
jgi:hypothetical protein